MIDQYAAEVALQEALKTGGDFSELFVEDRENLSLSMLRGVVENVSAQREYGAGLRILKGTRSVYAYSNDTSAQALLLLAREAAAALEGLEKAGHTDIAFAATSHDERSGIDRYPSDVPQREKIALMRRANDAARAESSEISQVSVGYGDVDQRVLICNSEGLWAEDRRVRTRIMINAIASNGAEFQTGSEAPGRSMGFEVFDGEIDVETEARSAARQAVTMLHAPECPAGEMSVVIDGGFGGVIFHEACGHALEATSVGKGNSVFCGKLGQKIASDCVTAIDDGAIPNAWGTLDIDDEGRPTQHNLLIHNGVLTGYLIDRLGARRMGMSETGSGRRESYRFAPTSRMNNTYIAAGNDDPDAMLTHFDGLFAKSMGGGSVNPLTGEFNFAVREGYLYQNGTPTPVRGATLIGKGADVLMRIDAVGTRMWMGAGMCGSLSGSVPTNVGQPRIRVTQMTVGGKGGAR